MGGSIGKLFVEIGADTSGLNKGLSGAQNKVNAFGAGVKKSGAKIGAGMSSAGRGLTAGVTAPLVAAGAGFIALSGKAANFENQMNEVFTLMPGMSKDAMDDMTDDVLKFSREMGTLPNESIPALYQAISAGVSKDNVFDFLTVANKAAIGGVTDLETAVDGITSVVNAYGSDVVDATEASDLMFTAVKLGKTNFDELSSSLFQVIPTASALGVEFGDVTAALATMTAQGTPTAVATTQLRQLFVELSKDTSNASKAFKEVAGVGFQEFIAQGGNVQDALAIMQTAAGNNDVALQDMFGSVEAGNAALALTGKGAESFQNNLAEMSASMGATDAAFATMDEGAARSMAKLKAEFSAVAIELGDEFLPILKDDLIPIFRDDIAPLLIDVVVPAIKGLAGIFSKMSPGMRKVALIVAALAAAFGPVLMVLGPVIQAVTALAPVVTAVGTAIGGVALGPIVVVIAAMVALIAIVGLVRKAWSKNFGGIQEKTAAVFEGIKTFITGLGDKLLFILGPIGAIIYAFKNWDDIKEIVSGIFGSVLSHLDGLWQTFKDAGSGLVQALIDGITAKMGDLIKKAKELAQTVRDYLPGSDAKKGPLNDITSSGAGLATTLGEGFAGETPAQRFASRVPNAGASYSNSNSNQGASNTTPQTIINVGTVNESSAGNVADAIDRALRKSITLNPW